MAEALQDYSATETPILDTGTLQTDLLELLRGIITRIQTPVGKVIDQIVVGHYPQPELEEVRRAYWRDRFNRAEALIQRAKDRGELPEEMMRTFWLKLRLDQSWFERMLRLNHLMISSLSRSWRFSFLVPRAQRDTNVAGRCLCCRKKRTVEASEDEQNGKWLSRTFRDKCAIKPTSKSGELL